MNSKNHIEDPLFLMAADLLPETDRLELEPTLFPTREGLSIGLRVGVDRLYVVRHIPHFLRDYEAKEKTEFGKGFELDPHLMRFDDEQMTLLNILTEYCDAMPQTAVTGAEARVLLLKKLTAHRVLQVLSGMPFRLSIGSEVTLHDGIVQEDLPIICTLSGTTQKMHVRLQLPMPIIKLLGDCSYVVNDGRVFHLSDAQSRLLRCLSGNITGGEKIIEYTGDEIPQFLNEVLPILTKACSITVDESLSAHLNRTKLTSKVYLDKDGSAVSARVSFCYGQEIIDPFDGDQELSCLLLRDVAGESQVMQVLSRAGFHVSKGMVYLRKPDKIYDFVTSGVNELNQIAEVFFSFEFKKLSPKKPRLSGKMSVRNGRIELRMMNENVEIDELLPLMRALSEKKNYFRFKSGEFLDLTEQTEWQALAEAVVESNTEEDFRPLALCRAAYLSALIEQSNLPVELDDEVRSLAQMRYQAPDAPFEGLRPYQKRGYEWLMTLDELKMGGILADDMGLGKTIQMIAAIDRYVMDAGKFLPSLIVAPTSLQFNWLSEFRRFAPGLKLEMIRGSQQQRAEQMERIKEEPPHVIITSYPLIRRDIDLMETIEFRFAVLDEAQQIKNTQSVGAHAVKRLNAQTKIALTGTPMENHTGELWSLMDFCLPGYLPPYSLFLKKYGEGENGDDLRKRIRPFLMRRVKNDVLTELPELLESTLYAELMPEQRRMYDAVLMQTRHRVDEILNVSGIGRGRAEILSAIMQLRQICCDPELCLQGYSGGSGKSEMLMDIVPDAVHAGHRILLFSQFTTMLRLLEKRLKEAGLRTMYLDGETPPETRQQLTEAFNGGEGDVFLISLKAGGTGLNLTGADMVIHYDPWWNPTAQDQATGRAHRIGQTHTVTVLSLVTHGTIEEEVVKMSKKKRKLFDQLITAGEALPTSLSNEDILSLFGK